MIIGVFSDAHGNNIGFKTCLNFLQQAADKIFFLGDAVGYIPYPNEIVDVLRGNKKIHSLLGNLDAMILGELAYDTDLENVYLIEKSKKRISSDNILFLSTLSPFHIEDMDGKRILFVHGNPFDPLRGYFYPDTPIEKLQNTNHDVVFMGHTHRSFIKFINNKLIVNVGSCGLSRDQGNKISVTLYNTKTNIAEIIKLDLDIEETINRYGSEIHNSVINLFKRDNS